MTTKKPQTIRTGVKTWTKMTSRINQQHKLQVLPRQQGNDLQQGQGGKTNKKDYTDMRI